MHDRIAPRTQGISLEDDPRGVFERIASFTLGAEQEFILVDPHTFLPRTVGDLDLASWNGRLVPELRSCQVEVVTPVCASVDEVARELAATLSLLRLELAGRAAVMSVGAHPFARDIGPISPTPRHQGLAADYPWAARHALTCGLHVHVAVGGADRALAVHNALRSYLPELAALASNSPFHQGQDSCLASVRHALLRLWPRAGVPPIFYSWPMYSDFLTWGRSTGACPDHSYQWWDLRLNPHYGTIEVRVADAQTRVEDAATVAAFTQALVADLATRFDRRELPPSHDSERIAEGLWLAARDGIYGFSIDLDSGERIPMIERLRRLTDALLPTADLLGCVTELLAAETLIRDPAPTRQRRIASTRGVEALATWLTDETTCDGAPLAGSFNRAARCY